MGREPDQAGYDYWCEKIASGMTREQVFAGFGNSLEFNQTCSNYGITAGYYTEDIDAGRLNALNLFVGRMYTTTLGRTAEQEVTDLLGTRSCKGRNLRYRLCC